MQLAIISNGNVTTVGDYRSLFPQTSFPATGPDASFLQENSAQVVTLSRPHNQETHKLVSVPPYIEAGQVYTVRVEPLTPAELQQRTDAVAASVRMDRNARLTASDFTQLADYSKQDQQAWRQYRQALRDVPQQAGFPRSVVWPTAPGASPPNNNGTI
jgi:hypothetical protein